MQKLKLGPIEDDKPVKLTVEFPGSVYRELLAYGQLLSSETSKSATEPAKLVPLMVQRFMATDRAFTSARRARVKS